MKVHFDLWEHEVKAIEHRVFKYPFFKALEHHVFKQSCFNLCHQIKLYQRCHLFKLASYLGQFFVNFACCNGFFAAMNAMGDGYICNLICKSNYKNYTFQILQSVYMYILIEDVHLFFCKKLTNCNFEISFTHMRVILALQ